MYCDSEMEINRKTWTRHGLSEEFYFIEFLRTNGDEVIVLAKNLGLLTLIALVNIKTAQQFQHA